MILLMAMLVIINYYKWFFLKESTCSPHYAKLQYGLNPLGGLLDSKKPSSTATFGNNICQLYQQ